MDRIAKLKAGRKHGFTLVEIMIVVLIIGILMAIAVPNFIKARENSRRNSCIANLKQIDSAKEQYAMDQKLATGAAITMANLTDPTLGYMKGALTGPTCASGGVYTVNVVGTPPTCSLAAAPNLHVLP
jgi:prepilin-type N-terminal cleavage/methylation domain-containing protein